MPRKFLRYLLPLAVLLVFLALTPFANWLFETLAGPLTRHLPEGSSMIATQVASPFLIPFKLAMVLAIFIAIPVVLYQAWAFIAPGMYRNEKRFAMPVLASSVVLFYCGAAFAYFVVFPLIFAFFTSVGPEGITIMTDINSYLNFVLKLFFAFGVAFEIPVATIILLWTGVTTRESLAKGRPYIIVGAFVIGMLLTPPDVISQVLLALPMWVLFEVGLLFSRMIQRDRKKRAEDEEQGEADMPAAAGVPAAQSAGAGVAAADIDSAEFEPPDEQAMEDEFDRIEAQFDALEEGGETDSPDAGAASRADTDDSDEDDEDGYDEAEASTELKTPDDALGWTAEDSADMLDEEDEFPARTAIEALVDAKLEQVAALRATGADEEARRLLYEVLSEGDATQVRVARNILDQLDS